MMHSYSYKTGARDSRRIVRKHLARALVGQAVELLVDAHTIVHGIVTGVMTEAGTPKLVVGGTRYDLNQILTATPASFDPPCSRTSAAGQPLQPQH